MVSESTEGRLTTKKGPGQYSIKPIEGYYSQSDLVTYIGMLEDFIGTEHHNVWADLNLKKPFSRHEEEK